MTIDELKALPLDQALLVAFDTETTGVDPQEAHIVEFGMVQLEGKGFGIAGSILFDPGIPRADWLEAQEVCGWTPEELATVYGSPMFAEIGAQINGILSGKVVAGYNLLDYDIPLLNVEERRCGLPETQFPLVIDVLVMVRKFLRHYRERNLGAISTSLGYVGRVHRAVDDCYATLHILDWFWRQGSLPKTVGEICAVIKGWKFQQDTDNANYSYWLYTDRCVGSIDVLRMGCGKLIGKPLAECEKGLIRWYLNNIDDLPEQVRAMFQHHMNGR